MSILHLPNEVLALVFENLLPINVANVKMVNKRFEYVVEAYRVELPLARKLKIHQVCTEIGGCVPNQIQIIAEVPKKKQSGNTVQYEDRVEKITTKGKITSIENISNQIAKVLKKIKIRGCQELEIDSSAVHFDLIEIFRKIGFNYGEITSVRRKLNDMFGSGATITLPFIDDAYIKHLHEKNLPNIVLNCVESKVTILGIIKVIEKRISIGPKENSHFGIINMTKRDHMLLSMFFQKCAMVDKKMFFSSWGQPKINGSFSIYNDKKTFEWYFIDVEELENPIVSRKRKAQSPLPE